MTASSSAAGTTGRNTAVAHFLAPHWERIAERLAPVIDREGSDAGDAPRALVCVPDSGAAVELANALRSVRPEIARILPVTDALRAARVLKAYGAPIVIVTPGDADRLLAASALALDGVQVVALVAADEFNADQLAAIMASVPKEARRVLVASDATPAVEMLLERYFHKAHRLADDSTSETTPAAVQFLLVRSSGAASSVASILDDIDPPSAVVITTDPDSVHEALAAHGYPAESDLVKVSEGEAPANVALVIFAGLPSATAFETAMQSQPGRAVALVAPRQLAMLKRLAGSAGVTPYTARRATAVARAHDDRLRAELKAAMEASYPAREIIALEPLLAEYDGVELAGVAVRLLEVARAQVAAPVAASSGPNISSAAPTRPVRDRSDRSARPARPRDDFPLKDPLPARPKPRFEDRTVRRDRDERPRRPFGDKPREGGDERPRRSYGDKPREGAGERRPYGDKPRTGAGDKRSFGDKPRGSYGDKPRGSFGDKRGFGDKPRGAGGDKPRGGFGAKPRSAGPRRPRDDR